MYGGGIGGHGPENTEFVEPPSNPAEPEHPVASFGLGIVFFGGWTFILLWILMGSKVWLATTASKYLLGAIVLGILIWTIGEAMKANQKKSK